MSSAVFPRCVTSGAGDGCREYSCQNVPSDKSNHSLGGRVHPQPQRVSETRPGLVGAIAEKCEVASSVTVGT